MNKKAKTKSSRATVSTAASTIPTFAAPPAIPVGAIPEGKVVDFLTGKLVNDPPEEYVRQNIEKALIRQYKYAAAHGEVGGKSGKSGSREVGDIHDRYLSRMDAVIRNLPSAGARCSAVTLRSPSVFANQVTRSTSHVTRHPCARIGSPHLSGGGPSRKIQFGFSGPPASKQTIRTHQRFPRKLSRKPLRVVPHRRGPAGSS